MSGMYKTPGVYVEEIPKFPPSIAPVETAIPAFIGYTEKAERNGETLNLKPTRIESIAEYELYFGGGPSQKVNVTLDANNQVVKAEGTAQFYLYDSLRMFYANGGGNCYIVSVNPNKTYPYPGAPNMTDLETGIEAIAIEDEPTILVFPDAVTLNSSDLYSLQQTALEQCKRLMDRVVLCDLAPSADAVDFKTSVTDFRDNIGINSLKYGVAYGPWINANLPRSLKMRDIVLIDNSSATIELKSLTTDPDILQIIFDATESAKALDTLNSAETTKWEDQFKQAVEVYNSAPNYVNVRELYGILVQIIAEVGDMAAMLPSSGQTQDFKLGDALDKYIANAGVKEAFEILVVNHNTLYTATADAAAPNTDFELMQDPADLAAANALIGTLSLPSAPAFVVHDNSNNPTLEGGKELSNANLAKAAAVQVSNTIIAFYRFAQSTAAQYEKQFNDALLNAFGAYKNIVTKAAAVLNTIPPSGAVAGVYASVDRERGVWKAPANVSLNAVIGPAVKISHEQQAEFNVDVNAGKSINIIRSFTGKGTLVWGARTLAGNDNEWRYVSVRRFFNFVEESVKKATEQFVFEPNDANTWVRVQAMIENFLTTLWRQGALQGVKPEHAFYVAVGLGKTMTPLDILEGRMIIEIGMAAVRPAEFIILRFSHKMAES